MKTRAEVQEELEELIGSSHVYYQPPETLKMRYPCIVYNQQRVDRFYADDGPWAQFPEYLVNYIGRDPDDPVLDRLMQARNLVFDRHYVSDNLHHNVFTYKIY